MLKFLIVLALTLAERKNFILKHSLEEIRTGQLEFKNWLIGQGKEYGSVLDYIYRLSVFIDNKKRVENHNKKKHSYKLQLNHFADLTSEEFLAKYTSAKIQNKALIATDEGKREQQKEPVLLPEIDVGDLPQRIDWVEKGALNPIQNQGSCGSCYAFSTIAAIEAASFINRKPVNEKFSEQYVVDCGTQRPGYKLYGCNGGLLDDVYRFCKNYGVFKEEDYPYRMKEEYCPLHAIPDFHISDWVMIKSNSMKQLLSEIVKGPVALAIEVTSSYQFYASGVIDIKAPCGFFLNHGVTAVGYDLTGNPPYILVRNSYGVTWGEFGYFKHAIGDLSTSGSCGIANENCGRPII